MLSSVIIFESLMATELEKKPLTLEPCNLELLLKLRALKIQTRDELCSFVKNTTTLRALIKAFSSSTNKFVLLYFFFCFS